MGLLPQPQSHRGADNQCVKATITEDDWQQRRLLPQGVRLHERVGEERERTARRAVRTYDCYVSDVP